MVGFVVCLFIAAFCFGTAFLYLPFLILKVRCAFCPRMFCQAILCCGKVLRNKASVWKRMMGKHQFDNLLNLSLYLSYIFDSSSLPYFPRPENSRCYFLLVPSSPFPASLAFGVRQRRCAICSPNPASLSPFVTPPLSPSPSTLPSWLKAPFWR